MNRYIGTKIVLAEPMNEATAQFNGLTRSDSVTIKPDGSSKLGYIVVYEDGYKSWSPKDTFERCYRLVTEAEYDLIKSIGLSKFPLRVHQGGHTPRPSGVDIYPSP